MRMADPSDRSQHDPNADRIRLLSIKEVAKMLNMSIRTVHRKKRAKEIPAPLHIGGSRRWHPGDIAAWILAGCPRQR